MNWLDRIWYRTAPPPVLLMPLAAAYGAIAARRAAAARAAAIRLPVPVIVVGNLSVGGTGKTPLTIALVEILRGMGRRPGVVSRGYGGRAPHYPLRVDRDSDPALAGDEPVLIARVTGVPVAVAPDRVLAARQLIDDGGVDVIVADDGLQHHRLGRDLEICVVDGGRGLGNGGLLPAGPLREPSARLNGVDLIVVNGGGWRGPGRATPTIDMRLQIESARAMEGDIRRALSSFAGRPVHAVAGIGRPERFFQALRDAGLDVIAHPFPDHHRYTAADLRFDPAVPTLMTEKDAVKIARLDGSDRWSVPAQPRFSADDLALMRNLCASVLSGCNDSSHG